MQIYCSDLCLLGGRLDDNIQQLLSLGFSHLELMMEGASWDGFWANEEQKRHLLSLIRSYPITCSIHSPCWDINMASESRHIREASLQSALAALEFAAELGCTHLVVHPGFCQTPRFDRVTARQRAYSALETICQRAEATGVRVAVENVGHHGTCLYSYEEFIHLLDGLGPHVGYLLDVGHAILNGWNLTTAVQDMAGRLFAFHLHDNDGVTDSHLPLGKGIIPWEALLREIGRLPQSVNLVLEYNYDTPLEHLREGKHMLQALLSL